jgi:hypothetical protein
VKDDADAAVEWVGYIVFSVLLIVGTGLVAYEFGLRDTKFSVAMMAAWVFVIAAAFLRRARQKAAEATGYALWGLLQVAGGR